MCELRAREEGALPPCHAWNVWVGEEIEGSADLGEKTLFVRRFCDEDERIISSLAIFQRAREEGINRVWFCEEHQHFQAVADALHLFEKVCICLEATDRHAQLYRKAFPPEILKRIRFYLKLDELFTLSPGDFVCVGPKYADTAYQIGEGRSVQRSQYNKDQRWF